MSDHLSGGWAIEPPNNVGTVSMKDLEEAREALAAATRGPVTT